MLKTLKNFNCKQTEFYVTVMVAKDSKGVTIRLIKTVIFDLDDTLLWDEKSVELAFEETCKHAQTKYDVDPKQLEIRVRENAKKIYASYPTYEFTKTIGINEFEGLWGDFPDEGGMFPELRELVPVYRKDAWTQGLKDLGIDDEKFGEELGETFPEERKKSARLYDDSLEILKTLENDYELVLLTNGSPALQNLKLELSPSLIPFFSHTVISGDFGKGKPDVSIFEHTLGLAEREKEDVIMVGDNLKTDILGAVRTGIISVWVNRNGEEAEEVKPDHEINGLMELTTVLETYNKSEKATAGMKL